jgi:hypothetical protein
MALKSSWELALERTGGKTTAKLTAGQKEKMAELDRVYSAKIAQVELDLKPKIATGHASGDAEGAGKIEEAMRAEIQKLRGKLEDEKDKVRKQK